MGGTDMVELPGLLVGVINGLLGLNCLLCRVSFFDQLITRIIRIFLLGLVTHSFAARIQLICYAGQENQ